MSCRVWGGETSAASAFQRSVLRVSGLVFRVQGLGIGDESSVLSAYGFGSAGCGLVLYVVIQEKAQELETGAGRLRSPRSSQVDMLGLRYTSINFGGKSPGQRAALLGSAGLRRTLSSEYGPYKTVKARFWLPGKSPKNVQVVASSLGSGLPQPTNSQHPSSSLLLPSLELNDTKSMSLKYEPASEPASEAPSRPLPSEERTTWQVLRT